MSPEESKFIDELYHTYAKQLWKYAMTCVKNKALADELVADTFHVAMEDVARTMTRNNPGGWLLGILGNKIKQKWTSQRQDARRLLEYNEEVMSHVPMPARPTEEEVEQEIIALAEAQKKIKTTLTAVQFYILKRVTLEDMTHKAVAEELGISVWNSQKILERARRALHRVFPDYPRKKKKK